MVRNLTDLLISVVKRNRGEEQVDKAREICLVCDASLVESRLYEEHRICHVCRFHYSMTARERIESLVDRDSFKEINRSLISLDPLSFSSRVSYKERLFRDQRRTGLTEAVVTGTCAIGGSPTMLIVLDFGFMGGTVGCVVGEKLALALEQAVKRKLPAVAIVTSGGVRIQEGVLSLMQMAKTSIAANQLHVKGLPYVTVLANPTTGQAFASFANLSDIVVAEPGAVVGFSPLRVIKEKSEHPLPRGSYTAEAQLKHGMLDAVVDRTELRHLIAALLDLLGPQYQLSIKQRPQTRKAEPSRAQAWSSVQLARHEARPTSLDYIGRIFTSFVELHGDRCSGDDPAIVGGIGHLGSQTVAVLAQERNRRGNGVDRNDGRTSPEGFRKAQRVLKLASKFDIPLVTLIDTPGPNISLEAEERGLGYTIANTIATMASAEVPSISVILGEGGRSGALALSVADRVLMMENAIYTAISPEDAAEVLYQDEAKVDEVAQSLKLTARDCAELGIIDATVPEPPGGAHTSPDEAARQLRRALLQHMAELQSMSKRRMLRARYKKFRNMGEYSSHFRAAITRDVNALQGLAATSVKRIVRKRRSTPEDLADILQSELHAPDSPEASTSS